jgi:hypothetical protein
MLNVYPQPQLASQSSLLICTTFSSQRTDRNILPLAQSAIREDLSRGIRPGVETV